MITFQAETQNKGELRQVFYEFPFTHSLFEDHIFNRRARRVRAKGHYLAGLVKEIRLI